MKKSVDKLSCLELNHSHKKRKDSLETRVVLIEISMLCWHLPSGPKHWGSLQKNMTFPEGNKLFASNFRANLDETNADMVPREHMPLNIKSNEIFFKKYILAETFSSDN